MDSLDVNLFNRRGLGELTCPIIFSTLGITSKMIEIHAQTALRTTGFRRGMVKLLGIHCSCRGGKGKVLPLVFEFGDSSIFTMFVFWLCSAVLLIL